MAIYVVMEAPGAADADGTRDAIYVRDGFSVIAFLAPAFWLLWHRLWIEALLVFAVLLCLGSFGAFAGLGAGAVTLLSLLIGLYVALEGPALRLAALRRRGWREWGVVRADSRDEADMRYVHDTDEETPPAPALREAAHYRGPKPTAPAMGLFDYPGGR